MLKKTIENFPPVMPLTAVVEGAIGAFGPYCMGYMNPGASGGGYIATMKLSVDKVSTVGLDEGTGGIVSYDRCEKDDAYIGQINMGTASSFCGVNGALWGYHLATAEAIADRTLQPMFTYPGPDYPPNEELPPQGPVPVYPVAPLLDAAERLFGRVDKDGSSQTDLRRFPPMPGAHVICANKDSSGPGPAYFWCILGIAIAEDRETQANLFIEDASSIPATQKADGTWSPTMAEVADALEANLKAVAKSMVLCGQDQDVTYGAIYLGAKYIFADVDEWGCALTCAPYVTLAQNAVPNSAPSALLNMTIAQWEEAVGMTKLPPAPTFDGPVGEIGANLETDFLHRARACSPRLGTPRLFAWIGWGGRNPTPPS